MASLTSSQINGRNSLLHFGKLPRSKPSSCRVGFRVLAAAEDQTEPDLSVKVNGLQMPNPFVIGSGPPGTNYTVMKKAFDEGWGAVIAKTKGWQGELVETQSGSTNPSNWTQLKLGSGADTFHWRLDPDPI